MNLYSVVMPSFVWPVESSSVPPFCWSSSSGSLVPSWETSNWSCVVLLFCESRPGRRSVKKCQSRTSENGPICLTGRKCATSEAFAYSRDMASSIRLFFKSRLMTLLRRASAFTEFTSSSSLSAKVIHLRTQRFFSVFWSSEKNVFIDREFSRNYKPESSWLLFPIRRCKYSAVSVCSSDTELLPAVLRLPVFPSDASGRHLIMLHRPWEYVLHEIQD